MTARSSATGARERGAALLTVLVLTATMSAVAVSVLEDIRFSIRRSANVRTAEQAFWYALGAEALGMAVIRRAVAQEPNRASLRSLWAREAQSFPVEGGLITGRVRDGGNCFNLNSLVRAEGGGRRRRDDAAAEQFARLLAALEIDRGRRTAIVGAVVDWLDDDARPSRRGAEDHAYAGRQVPYRTAGASMAELSELRAVDGVDAALYRQLAPVLCAHPSSDPSRLNVNTLRETDAPLLVMLIGEELRPSAAQGIILDRPDGGFASIDDFWAHPAFSDIDVTEAMRRQAGVMTRHYEIIAEVLYHDTGLRLVSFVRLDEANRLLRLNRRLERGL